MSFVIIIINIISNYLIYIACNDDGVATTSSRRTPVGINMGKTRLDEDPWPSDLSGNAWKGSSANGVCVHWSKILPLSLLFWKRKSWSRPSSTGGMSWVRKKVSYNTRQVSYYSWKVLPEVTIMNKSDGF